MNLKKLITFVLMTVANPVVHAGVEVGNGGDPVGIEFQSSLQQAFSNLKDLNSSDLKKLSRIEISKSLPNLKVVVTSEPLVVAVKGIRQESTALNFPLKQLIKVNRDRWNKISDIHLKEALALHEGLSLLSFESSGNYRFSAVYAGKYGISRDELSKAVGTFSVYQESANDVREIISLPIFSNYKDYLIQSIRYGESGDGEGGEGAAYFVRLEKPFTQEPGMCLVFMNSGEGWKVTDQEACDEGWNKIKPEEKK